MADYSAVYKQGLPYFEDDLRKTIHAVDRGQCVALCSAYKMGDRRFVDYLNFMLSRKNDIDVSYDAENSYTRNQLHTFQEKPSSGKKVLLLPWFWRMDTRVIKQYTEVMRDKRNTFISVIVLEPEFLDHPESVFPDTNLPFEVLLIRKPLSPILTEQLLKTRCELANATLTQQQRKQILTLGGGHIGLTKRLFNLAIQGTPQTLEYALRDPAIKTDLLNLEHQCRTLSLDTCQTIGLLRKDGTSSIPLLRHFIGSISADFSASLTPFQQELLTLFEQKKGQIVSKNEIHRLMNTDGHYSLWAVYKVISRFAAAVSHKYRVRNISGKGYILVAKSK